jgi:hypothetical protein
VSDQESRARLEQRAREIEHELDRLDRGILPDRVIGKWGTVSQERLARLKRSLCCELDEITRVYGATDDFRFLQSDDYRISNLRESGLGPDGSPINEAACRTPCSLARWPQGRWGTEWASHVGSPRYSDRDVDFSRRR